MLISKGDFVKFQGFDHSISEHHKMLHGRVLTADNDGNIHYIRALNGVTMHIKQSHEFIVVMSKYIIDELVQI